MGCKVIFENSSAVITVAACYCINFSCDVFFRKCRWLRAALVIARVMPFDCISITMV